MTDTTLTVLNGLGATKTIVAEVSGSDLIPVHRAQGPDGAALALDSTLAAFSAKLPASVGAKAVADSLSVTFATGIGTLGVTQSGTWSVAQSGSWSVAQSGSWSVTANAGTGTFAISAASLPLPSGASTSANQSTIIGHVDGIEAALATLVTDTAAIKAGIQDTTTASPVKAKPIAPSDLSGTASTTASSIAVPSGTQTFDFWNTSSVIMYVSWTNTDPDNGEAGVFPVPAASSGTAGYYAAPAGMYGTFYVKAASGTGNRYVALLGT